MQGGRGQFVPLRFKDGRFLAAGTAEGPAIFWEVLSGKAVAYWRAARGCGVAVAFAPDAEPFAPQEWTGTFCLDANETAASPESGAISSGVDAKDLPALWRQLAHADAGVAYRAIWELRAQARPRLDFLTKT